jgi:Domain of unknown function (DUF4145)
MDWLQFIASIFKSLVSLAWPAAVFGCVLLFRDKLAELLPLFQVKHKDWEASFRWAQAEKEAAKLSISTTSDDVEQTPEEKRKFEQIARLSPRAALLETRANLEEAVRSFGQAVGVSNISPYMNYASLIRTLRKNDLIDANTSALLDDLRAIGNAAAHNQSDPTEQDAVRFRDLADKLIRQFEIATGAAQMPPPGPIPSGP